MTKNTHYIFSTLTSGQVYTRTAAGGADLPQTVGEVFIAGGSNISDKYLRTPIGVMTAVTDEELAILQDNEVFKLHEKNGFITIKGKPADPEKVAADMITRDQSAPTVAEDFETPPVTNEPEPAKPTKTHSRRA